MKTIHTSLYEYMRDFHKKENTPAVICGSRVTRFDKLFKEIDRVAASLYKFGIRKGDTVMLALPNILQNVVAVYAVSRIGAVAAMIHPLWSADEFEGAVKRLSPKLIFLSDVNLKKFWGRCHGVKRVICPYLMYAYIGLPVGGKFEEFHGDGEEPMFYLQSGGTSGTPKTIVLSSRAVNSMVENLCLFMGDRFDENNRMLCVMPMFHGFGLCIGVHASLSTKMTSVLMSRFNAKKVAKVIYKRRITNMLAVPRMVSKLLALEEFSGDRISSLQEIYVGGDSVSDELVAAFEERMKAIGGDAKLLPGYGLTETVTVCALTKGQFKQGSVGFMLDGMEAMIVGDDLKPLPQGERGELIIAGGQLMSGYYNDEEATKQALIEIGGKTWVRTGDIASLDSEGRIYFVGRKKRLIKISGMNVFPSDIEGAARELDFVGDCIALGYHIGDKPFIRLIVEGSLSEEQKIKIIEHIKLRLSHWNTPNEVIALERLPRTQIGKIDVAELEKLYGGRE